MYAIDIYSHDSMTRPLDTFFSPQCIVRHWHERINAAGSLSFSIPSFNQKATSANIKPYNIVRLRRKDRSGGEGYARVWLGHIIGLQESNGMINIECIGRLQIFEKRLTNDNETFNGQGSTEAFGLLSDANSFDNTFITQGDGGVSTTRTLTATGRMDMLSALSMLAKAHDAEYMVDCDSKLHFVDTLGSDKSGSITLTFRTDGKPATNLVSFDRGSVGNKMANYIIGKSGLLSYTAQNTSSQAEYGKLSEVKTFEEAKDQTTLNAMTESYLTQMSEPLADMRVIPELSTKKMNVHTGNYEIKGLDYGDVSIGDLVKCVFVTNNENTEDVKRVIEKYVDVSPDGSETLSFTLSKASIKQSMIGSTVSHARELAARIKKIEQLL